MGQQKMLEILPTHQGYEKCSVMVNIVRNEDGFSSAFQLGHFLRSNGYPASSRNHFFTTKFKLWDNSNLAAQKWLHTFQEDVRWP